MSITEYIIPADLDFESWLKFGMDQGWVGPPVCETHDGFPMSDEEWAISDIDGEPPCMHMLRLYDDAAHRDAVEAAHSPSQWRKNR
jgi:hypothetical protein